MSRSEEKKPSVHSYFMNIAVMVSKRGTCNRKQVGCILVKDKRIITTGYNGAAQGVKDCRELGCVTFSMG